LSHSIFKTSAEFDTLFREHYPRLVHLSYRILRRQDLAEDAVQDVFIRLWRQRATLEVTTTIAGLLNKAVVNESLNVLQRERRHLSADMPEIPADTHDDDHDLIPQLRKAIDQLPDKCRALFMLNRYEGLTINEIADYMGLAPKTVENQLGRALKLLRVALAKK
jgi:RNA polymerase sigma-19 factor, ECF subfamily